MGFSIFCKKNFSRKKVFSFHDTSEYNEITYLSLTPNFLLSNVMLWIIPAVLGYFLNAVASVIDKFLVVDRVEKPAVYAFLVSLFSLVSFVFAPFGLALPPLSDFVLLLLSGASFLFSLVFLFSAFRNNEVSRIVPLVGIVAALVAFFPSFLAGWTDGEASISGVVAFFLLLSGAILLSFRFSENVRYAGNGFLLALLSGVFLACFNILLKIAYADGVNFVTGLVWSRLGILFGGMLLLIIPTFRDEIVEFFRRFLTASNRSSTSALFLAGKTLAGVGSLFLVLSVRTGPVAFVQAFIGVQLAFVFLLALLLAKRYPKIFEERFSFLDWIQKAGAFALLSIGVWLASSDGALLF